jgi:hypothetical protein
VSSEPRRIAALLDSIGCADDAIVVTPIAAGAAPYLVAHIATPGGPRRLGGP